MKMRMKRERRRRRRRGRGRGKRERQREKRKHRHGPQTLMLLREPLLRSQSVACAEVQAGAFKALAGLAPTKNLPDGQTLWSVFQDGSNETRKTRVRVSWSSQAVLKVAAFGAHARQASANEPSGARLFSGFWIESGHGAHDHGAQFELGLELSVSKRRFPLLPEVKIEWAQVWRARRPMSGAGFGAPSKTPWCVG